MKKPKSQTHKIPPHKLRGDHLENATMVGCVALLTPMGDSFKFKLGGIKYTFKREWED